MFTGSERRLPAGIAAGKGGGAADVYCTAIPTSPLALRVARQEEALADDELPCPHCGAPIGMSLAHYFPRRTAIFCSACDRPSVLPLGGMITGIAVMLFVTTLGLLALSAFGLTRPDTVPKLLLAAVGILGVALLSARVASLASRSVVRSLTPTRLRRWERRR